VERTIAAPPEKVFDAWTQPETLKRWFAPSDEYTVVVDRLEVKVGGRYRIEMRHPGGNVHVAGGVYREVARPSHLVFTWAWEGRPAMGESRVTVRLAPEGRGPRLVLVHELLPSAKAREEHAKGWSGILERLVRLY
jgi:uncharacterized protein YndB with AHSA1/START domain